jgi:hypothetical protein
MTANLSSEQVWTEVEKQLFGILGFVTAKNEARTVGIVYAVRDHKLYIVTGKDTWKARYISRNPQVSMTVPIAKRIPLLPWIKIPAATITFSGVATVRDLHGVDAELLQQLLRGLQHDPEMMESSCIIEVEPVKDFVTYGVGVSLMTMRDTEMARGRVAVAAGQI